MGFDELSFFTIKNKTTRTKPNKIHTTYKHTTDKFQNPSKQVPEQVKLKASESVQMCHFLLLPPEFSCILEKRESWILIQPCSFPKFLLSVSDWVRKGRKIWCKRSNLLYRPCWVPEYAHYCGKLRFQWDNFHLCQHPKTSKGETLQILDFYNLVQKKANKIIGKNSEYNLL